METKLLDETGGQRTFAVVFAPGEEVMSGLQEAAAAKKLAGAHFTAIGAFSSLTLGFFCLDRKDYRRIPVREQSEVVSLIGNIALENDEPRVHAHAVVAMQDGTTRGGHLLEARVQPTLEVVLVESPRHLRRTPDAATGLALLDLSR
ncbi:MAG: PPC domain-containing DNA-binding protein [Candidatus Rokuibacteriota bacterium]